jgi:hypothetical protein
LNFCSKKNKKNLVKRESLLITQMNKPKISDLRSHKENKVWKKSKRKN